MLDSDSSAAGAAGALVAHCGVELANSATRVLISVVGVPSVLM